MFIGGSYISEEPYPNDLDILVCWHPKERLKNSKEFEIFINQNARLFDKQTISDNHEIQVHFIGLVGSPDTAINVVAKWTILNSFSRIANHHRGIVSLKGSEL
jgi:hypothetical protein